MAVNRGNSNQSPLIGPKLREDLPLYPLPLQALRVTAGTVPGPTGYASSSMVAPALYLAYTQQLVPGTLIPRDREPCFALDLNRTGLVAGYYTNCRLAGSYQSLPVYEIGYSGASPLSTRVTTGSSTTLGGYPSGPTQAQILSLNTLSSSQMEVLNNLTPCQLQTLLVSVPISQIQTLTSNLSSTQLANLVSQLSVTKLGDVYTGLTIQQISTLTSTLDQNQVYNFTSNLTTSQIRNLLTNLNVNQLITLSKLNPTQVKTYVDSFSTSQLQSLLNTSPLPTNPYDTGLDQTATFTSGTQNNVPVYGSTLLVPTNGATTITGFVPLNPNSAQTITIFNTGSSTLSLPNQNSSSSSTNQVKTSTGSTLSIPAGSMASITYNPATGYWTDESASVAVSTGSSSGARTEGVIAAGGTTQGTAVLLTYDANDVTGADGTKGVILDGTKAAAIIIVRNNTAPTLKIYPQSGAQISTNGTNASFPLALGSIALYRVTSTQWNITTLG